MDLIHCQRRKFQREVHFFATNESNSPLIYLFKIVKTIFTFGLQGWPQLIFSFSIFKSNGSGHDSSRGRTISKVTILLESWWNTVNYFWHFPSEIIGQNKSCFVMLMVKRCFLLFPIILWQSQSKFQILPFGWSASQFLKKDWFYEEQSKPEGNSLQ